MLTAWHSLILWWNDDIIVRRWPFQGSGRCFNFGEFGWRISCAHGYYYLPFLIKNKCFPSLLTQVVNINTSNSETMWHVTCSSSIHTFPVLVVTWTAVARENVTKLTQTPRVKLTSSQSVRFARIIITFWVWHKVIFTLLTFQFRSKPETGKRIEKN